MIRGFSSNLRRLEAEREADSLLKRLKIDSLPVDPISVAQVHDIHVKAKEAGVSGTSGCLVRVGSTFGILYAQHVRVEGFVRFTIAHELGHYFLPGHAERLFPVGDGVHESRSGFVSDDPYEIQADFFAAALLMPAPLFRQALRSVGSGFRAIEELASECRTSLTATAIRFAQFTDDPVAVLVSSGGMIDYCFLSEPLDSHLSKAERYKKGKLVPTRTVTAKFQKNTTKAESTSREEGYCILADWFEDAPEVEMEEDVVGLGSYGKTLTVLFTEEALEDEEELEGEDED